MTITKTSAYLTIINENAMTPDEMTAFIGRQPDMYQTKGKNIISGGKKIASSISKKNIWSISSRTAELKSPEFHINRILEMVSPYEDKIAALSKDNTVCLVIAVYSDNGKPPLKCDNNMLQRIARLGASLDFDLYVSPMRIEQVIRKFRDYGLPYEGKRFYIQHEKAIDFMKACNDEDLAILMVDSVLFDNTNPNSTDVYKLPLTLDNSNFLNAPMFEWKQFKKRCREAARNHLKQIPQYVKKYLQENPTLKQKNIYIRFITYDWHDWWENVKDDSNV